jgi:sialate O-acetylesterase
MIFSAVGGTAAELWTSPEALAANATGAEVLRSHGQAIREFPAKAASYKAKEPELLAQYTNALIAARAAGAPEPSLPAAPRDPSGSEPGLLFNGMIAPLIPYAMRGAIWYQGESNGGRGIAYRELFPLLIHDWRKRWHEEFPFCYVQLATYAKCDPLVREAQFLTLSKALNTAMVVTTDLGDANDVHPTRKREVGERLALTALAIAYHQAVDYSGPLYESCEFQGAEARLTFKHSRGLTASSGALAGFVIAGADKKFLPATAVVRGETVVVSSAAVQKPMAVRYNWAGVADGNLCNGAGLPASPFRTDVEPDR